MKRGIQTAARSRDPLVDEFLDILRVFNFFLRETEAKARRDFDSCPLQTTRASLEAIRRADDMILQAARKIVDEKLPVENFKLEMNAFQESLERNLTDHGSI
jgi:hypothetical protein